MILFVAPALVMLSELAAMFFTSTARGKGVRVRVRVRALKG